MKNASEKLIVYEVMTQAVLKHLCHLTMELWTYKKKPLLRKRPFDVN